MPHSCASFQRPSSQLDHFDNPRRHNVTNTLTDVPHLYKPAARTRPSHFFGRYYTFRVSVILLVIRTIEHTIRAFIVQLPHKGTSFRQRRDVHQVSIKRLVKSTYRLGELSPHTCVKKLLNMTKSKSCMNDPGNSITAKVPFQTRRLPFGYENYRRICKAV